MGRAILSIPKYKSKERAQPYGDSYHIQYLTNKTVSLSFHWGDTRAHSGIEEV